MLPSDFHPVLRTWWESRFTEFVGDEQRVLPPTPAQTEGWRAIRAGAHTLIAAPTGSGKTLAAFLTAIDHQIAVGAAHHGTSAAVSAGWPACCLFLRAAAP